MGENSKIEWCHNTFNPWVGCTKVSPGCDHCYAEDVADRFKMAEWGAGKPRKLTSDSNWNQPIAWNRRAKQSGVRERVFCASLADVFDNEVPEQWRYRLWKLIAATPNLDWLLLTKRIGNAKKMLPLADDGDPMRNVWLGISVVNQDEANRDIPKLLDIPAAVRFLSIEPLLGAIDLEYPKTLFPNGPQYCCSGRECGCAGQPIDPPLLYGIDWVIVGGESGAQARPMHPDWATALRDDCMRYQVPFLFKQWGEWRNGSTFGKDHDMAVLTDGRVLEPTPECLEAADRESPVMKCNPMLMAKVGKKRSGRFLDGRKWDQYPTIKRE